MDKLYIYATGLVDTSIPVEKKIQAWITFFFRKKINIYFKSPFKSNRGHLFQTSVYLKTTRIFVPRKPVGHWKDVECWTDWSMLLN